MINSVALDNLLKTAQTSDDWEIVWQTAKARNNQFEASLAQKWHMAAIEYGYEAGSDEVKGDSQLTRRYEIEAIEKIMKSAGLTPDLQKAILKVLGG
jgi:hypothetical protein